MHYSSAEGYQLSVRSVKLCLSHAALRGLESGGSSLSQSFETRISDFDSPTHYYPEKSVRSSRIFLKKNEFTWARCAWKRPNDQRSVIDYARKPIRNGRSK